MLSLWEEDNVDKNTKLKDIKNIIEGFEIENLRAVLKYSNYKKGQVNCISISINL
ncbi:hypothetical protein [Clostridium sp.]|uniref:hypothetical protein n=1 Tax=Clostridium sp. TaxID=1506 RepID=UPI003217A8EA